MSPGNIYNLVNFGNKNNYDLINTNLKNFLEIMITNKDYKKNKLISFMIFDFIELYFNKTSFVKGFS